MKQVVNKNTHRFNWQRLRRDISQLLLSHDGVGYADQSHRSGEEYGIDRPCEEVKRLLNVMKVCLVKSQRLRSICRWRAPILIKLNYKWVVFTDVRPVRRWFAAVTCSDSIVREVADRNVWVICFSSSHYTASQTLGSILHAGWLMLSFLRCEEIWTCMCVSVCACVCLWETVFYALADNTSPRPV